MRELYINYTLWKQIAQDNSFTVYEQPTTATSTHVWCGTRDVVYQSDAAGANFTDYDTTFPAGPGRVAVADADEAFANIIGLATTLEPRSGDGTLNVAQQILTLGQSPFLQVGDGSEQLNVNGLSAGSPVAAWNGTGIGDTGGDWTPSGQGSETAASMHSGTNGWDTGVTSGNNLTKFDSGADQDIVGTYDTLSFWMQPKAYPAGANLKIRWKTNGGGNAGGAELSISDYVTDFDIDVYQQVTIPIADFGLTGDVDKIQFKFSSQGGQHFWFDDIELNTSAGAGPYTYRVQAPAGEVWHVSMLVIMLSGPSADWDIGNFANISGLTNGLLIRGRSLSTGEVSWALNSKDNLDLFGRFHPQDDIAFSDGTLLVGFMVKPGLASIVVSDDEVVEILVRDNLEGLAGARAFAHYGLEIVT
jgi:hypothetical protein